jgi:diacylglycerol kinase family enzyme
VLPVLQQAAGMQVTVVQTTHSGHATEVAAQLELGSTDMLLCVGGDGTLWEALQVGRGGMPYACWLPPCC